MRVKSGNGPDQILEIAVITDFVHVVMISPVDVSILSHDGLLGHWLHSRLRWVIPTVFQLTSRVPGMASIAVVTCCRGGRLRSELLTIDLMA